MPEAVSQNRTRPRVALVMGVPEPLGGAPFSTAQRSAASGSAANLAFRATVYSPFSLWGGAPSVQSKVFLFIPSHIS
jgi:hypothetical protein